MNHYVMCPILFGLTVQLCPATPSCPLKRIGLIDPSRDGVLRVACAFAGYHAIKRACRKLRITTNTLTLEQRFAAHKLYVDFFWTEALDNGLRCNHFRPDFESSAALIWEHRTEHANEFVCVPCASVSVPTRTSQSSSLGTEISFIAGEDFQWLHVGLATGN